jgi:hypothetical protein
MKKILLALSTVLTLTSGIAQTTPFLTKTCYRGAFAPAPAPMWTDTWTEWDPQTKVYPAPTMTVTGNITTNTTWSTGQTVLLSSVCFVKNNSILTIQPGVTILGDKSITGAGLFVTTGSQLIANGTVTAPIVFTSNQAPGQRALGDWGGVVLMGLATNNSPAGTGTLTNAAGTNYVEGLPVSSDTQYGGTNDNDNSGSLKYVRIEFGGYVYQPNKEINGLTFGAVGRGTTIDFIQVSFSNDDSYEWFGGTVNCKHLVAYRGLDDDFDTDNGYRGTVQFGLGVRDPQISDQPAISTSEGFESDNDPNGTTATPQTAAIFSNITDIGPLRGVSTATYASGFRRGARIRRNSNLRIINSILMDHATRGVYIDGNLSEANAAANTLLFANNIVANYGQRATESQTASTAFNATINAWVKTAGNDTLPFNNVTPNSILTAPYSFLSPDYRPSATSLARSGASFSNTIVSPNTATSSPVVSVQVPSTQCIGSGTVVTPFAFVPSTTVTEGYCALSWSASAGAAISNSSAINPTIAISTVGSFTVYLTVTNENGVTTIPQAITTTTCTNVGIQSYNKTVNGVVLAPNPSNDRSTLQFYSSNVNAVNVFVTDLTGKIVMSMNAVNTVAGQNQVELSTSDLHNGIYFVTISTDNGKETVKLVVNH